MYLPEALKKNVYIFLILNKILIIIKKNKDDKYKQSTLKTGNHKVGS